MKKNKTDADTPTADDETLKELDRLQRYHDLNEQHLKEVRETREKWEWAKLVAKEARARHDKAVADLLAFGNDQVLPLLQDDPEIEEPAPWRDVRIDGDDEFDIPAAVATKLNEAGLETAGALSDFCAEHGEFWARDIKGIGAKAQQQIEDAWEGFWEAHPDQQEPEETDGEDDDETNAIAATIAKGIAKGPLGQALRAVAAATDPEILEAAAAHDECVDDERHAAIDKRIAELKAD